MNETPAAALMGLRMGIMTDAMRSAVFGRFDDWQERWQTPGGAAQNMTRGFLRSPLLAGPSALFTELGMQAAGVDTGRFLNTFPGAPLLGPAANLVLGEGFTAARNLSEGVQGDQAAFAKVVDKGKTRVPFFNIWQLRALDSLLSEE